jgi:hypothetical protein
VAGVPRSSRTPADAAEKTVPGIIRPDDLQQEYPSAILSRGQPVLRLLRASSASSPTSSRCTSLAYIEAMQSGFEDGWRMIQRRAADPGKLVKIG